MMARGHWNLESVWKVEYTEFSKLGGVRRKEDSKMLRALSLSSRKEGCRSPLVSGRRQAERDIVGGRRGFSFGRVKFETPVKHPSRRVNDAITA